MIGSNTTITTYRLVNSGNVADFSGTATVTGAPAYIESQNPTVAAVLGEQPGIKAFTCHVDPADYREGDKVVDAAGTEYRIIGIDKHEGNDDVEDLYVLTLHTAAKWHSD